MPLGPRKSASTTTIAMCLLGSYLASSASSLAAQAQPNPPIRIVRVGYGNVEGLKNSISLSSSACRIAKHLPPQDLSLPSDAFLASFPVMEVEELFDGQHYAEYRAQRQIAADGSSGCTLAVFVQRSATAELTCASKIQGQTSLLSETMDFDNPSSEPPTISEEEVTSSVCREKPRPPDLTGLEKIDAGGTRCVWNGDLTARKLAKLTGQAPSAPTGQDICLYELLPSYFYQGFGRPVILMSQDRGAPAGGTDPDRTLGELAAFGNLKLKSFSATTPIAEVRFAKSSVEAFLKLPTKTGL